MTCSAIRHGVFHLSDHVHPNWEKGRGCHSARSLSLFFAVVALGTFFQPTWPIRRRLLCALHSEDIGLVCEVERDPWLCPHFPKQGCSYELSRRRIGEMRVRNNVLYFVCIVRKSIVIVEELKHHLQNVQVHQNDLSNLFMGHLSGHFLLGSRWKSGKSSPAELDFCHVSQVVSLFVEIINLFWFTNSNQSWFTNLFYIACLDLQVLVRITVRLAEAARILRLTDSSPRTWACDPNLSDVNVCVNFVVNCDFDVGANVEILLFFFSSPWWSHLQPWLLSLVFLLLWSPKTIQEHKNIIFSLIVCWIYHEKIVNSRFGPFQHSAAWLRCQHHNPLPVSLLVWSLLSSQSDLPGFSQVLESSIMSQYCLVRVCLRRFKISIDLG